MMINSRKKLISGITLVFSTVALSSVVFNTAVAADAKGLYISGQIGASEQVGDSSAYGNNIAIDADFPGAFDSGNGHVAAIGLGYQFNDQFRLEGRITQREADFNDRIFGTGERGGEEYILNGDIESTSLTLEAFYDLTIQRHSPHTSKRVWVMPITVIRLDLVARVSLALTSLMVLLMVIMTTTPMATQQNLHGMWV